LIFFLAVNYCGLTLDKVPFRSARQHIQPSNYGNVFLFYNKMLSFFKTIV
jgi:hypothetical protein